MGRNYVAFFENVYGGFTVGQSKAEVVRQLKESANDVRDKVSVYSFVGGITFEDGSFHVHNEDSLFREQ